MLALLWKWHPIGEPRVRKARAPKVKPISRLVYDGRDTKPVLVATAVRAQIARQSDIPAMALVGALVLDYLYDD